MIAAIERRLVYPAPPLQAGDWTCPPGARDVQIPSEDGTLVWGRYYEVAQPRGQMLFCHGNGEHIGTCGAWVAALGQRLRVSVLAIDYRGYGRSPGRPDEPGILADGEAAQRWLASENGLSPEQIILYGRSLGGAVVVALAERLGTRLLVPERTFASMTGVAATLYPWLPVRRLMRNQFHSADRISAYHGPLLQLHGRADRLIPLEQARELFDACPSAEKRFWPVEGMGHNDAAPGDYFDVLADWIAGL